MKTVHEISRMTGVSIRTLHYYDEIGLLSPSKITQAGYRLYNDAALSRLQTILLFRELKFPLKEIKSIMANPDFDRKAALCQQIELLELQKERIASLISFARKLVKTGVKNMDFSAFDKSKIDEYAAEAKKRWGKTDAYKEYEQKSADRTDGEQSVITAGLMDFFHRFGEIKELSPDCEKAKKLAKELQEYISENFYNCTDEIFASLGMMYSAGGEMTDNIDKVGGQGTAEFSSKAIEAYCKK